MTCSGALFVTFSLTLGYKVPCTRSWLQNLLGSMHSAPHGEILWVVSCLQVMVFYKQCGLPKVSRPFFAERKSASAVPSRPALQTANDLHRCSFHYFFICAWLQSPIGRRASHGMINFMSSIMFTRPPPDPRLCPSWTAASCLACPGSRLITEKSWPANCSELAS